MSAFILSKTLLFNSSVSPLSLYYTKHIKDFARKMATECVPTVNLRTQHENKVKLYFIRHGESEANLKSQSNHVNLTELGKQQANYKVEFDLAYSSTAVRAVTTAKTMGSKLTAEAYDSLLEIEMGDFVGKPREEVYTEAVLNTMKSDYWHFAPPNGESSRQVEERMVKFLEEVVFPKVTKKPNSEPFRVAIFGHGYAFKCLLRHVLKLLPAETYKLQIENTSVTEIEFMPDDHVRVVKSNDVQHLKENDVKIT